MTSSPRENHKRLRQAAELLTIRPPRLRYVSHIEGNGENVFRSVDALGLEGMVSKRLESIYRPGVRSRDWIKIKCFRMQQFTIVGYTTDTVAGRPLLATLALAGGNRFAGRVEFGVPRRDETLLLALRSLGTSSPSVADAPQNSAIQWVGPRLAADVRCLAWTPGRHLRHAVL